MTRKLLPYEYQLIDALGVTKDEYLEFIAAQPIYEDPKQGTNLDIQNAETVAIVLAVVGVLTSAAAVIFAPKPPSLSIPAAAATPTRSPEVTGAAGSPQSRDQRYSPRFGFDGVQELSTYGEVLPLVYTNIAHNKQGGVRVSTALLWSAVLCFGGNQFMRLLLSVGAGFIKKIDIYRTAIGQLPLRDLTQSNVWAYFKENSYPTFSDLANTDNTFRDPVNEWRTYPTARIKQYSRTSLWGFSQAYALSTSSACGLTSTIPINVRMAFLDGAGNRARPLVNTTLSNTANYWKEDGSRPLVPVGTEFTLRIPNTLSNDQRAGLAEPRKVRRGEAASVFDGARFKIGSLILKVVKIYGSTTDEGDVKAVLRCERTGKFPYTAESLLHPTFISSRARDLEFSIGDLEAQVEDLESDKVLLTEAQKTPFIDPDSAEYEKAGADVEDYPGFGTEAVSQAIKKYKKYIRATKTVGWAGKAIKYIDKKLVRQTARLEKKTADLEKLNVPSAQGYYLKCLSHIEEAHYASTTKCTGVDFALKIRAYRRLSGRANFYGTNNVSYRFKSSDNGLQPRTVMFRVFWRFAGENDYISVPYIFCARGATEQELFTFFNLVHTNSNGTRAAEAKYWEVKLEPVIDSSAELNITNYCYLLPNGTERTLTAGTSTVRVRFQGEVYPYSDFPPIQKCPRAIFETDVFNYDTYSQSSFSFEQGPEVLITAVNEQRHEPWYTYSDKLYDGIATLGLHVFAAKTTESLRNVSTWVTEGKTLRPLSTNHKLYASDGNITNLVNSNPSVSSSYAPDIFLDTVLDDVNGIGQYASIHSVDVEQLAKSKKFCVTNKLFMDGVIASQQSWREFWSASGAFCLLELGRIGGRDSLIPAVPYDETTGAIEKKLKISALFTPGNILEGSYKEEFIDYGANVQDTVLDIVYRDAEQNDVFPRNASVEVYLADVDYKRTLRQSVDISQFVSRREQAVLFAKYLALSKRHIRRSIEFKTFPTDSPVFPGAYVYVEVGMNQWDRIYSGRIEAGGALNAPLPREIPNGTYTVFVYKSGQDTVQFSNVQVSGNTAPALASQADSLFVLGRTVKSKRVFRVTEVSMDEEGETTVRAVEHPTDSDGNSLIALGLTAKNNFYVDGELG